MTSPISPISHRFIPMVCLLLAVAIVPTIIHSYSGAAHDDRRTTAAIPEVLVGLDSIPSERAATWGKRRFDSDDWIERVYRDAGGQKLRLTVVRSYDPKSVYHHPELAVAYRTSFVGEDVIVMDERPEVPVHVLKPGPGVNASAMYVLHYDTRFVDNPIAFQIRAAGELLFSKRRPMTLFFLLNEDARAGDAGSTAGEAGLLFAAIDAFLNQ
jgi:hypothetical protein